MGGKVTIFGVLFWELTSNWGLQVVHVLNATCKLKWWADTTKI